MANKCASNVTCNHMQARGLQGRALALHTFWNCARVADNCARVAGNCARVAGSCSREHFPKTARQPQKVLELDLSRKKHSNAKNCPEHFLVYQRVLQVIHPFTTKSFGSQALVESNPTSNGSCFMLLTSWHKAWLESSWVNS